MFRVYLTEKSKCIGDCEGDKFEACQKAAKEYADKAYDYFKAQKDHFDNEGFDYTNIMRDIENVCRAQRNQREECFKKS